MRKHVLLQPDRGENPHKTVLQTDRLIIRKLTLSDLEESSEILSEQFDYYYGPFKFEENIEKRLEWIVSLSNWDYSGGLFGDRAIILKKNSALIGMCGIDPWVWSPKIKKYMAPLFKDNPEEIKLLTIEFELGYALKEKYRGKGYATEAVLKLIQFAFNEQKNGRILARTDRENEPSVKMMKRIGMETYENKEWGVGGLLKNSIWG